MIVCMKCHRSYDRKAMAKRTGSICRWCAEAMVNGRRVRKETLVELGIIQPPASSDPVNPEHYKAGGIEAIDYLRAKLTPEEFRGFLKGNAIKYLTRAEHKGGTEDYGKALWYVRMLAGEDPRSKP